MMWSKDEPKPSVTDAILVTRKDHGLMLATWQEHRGAYLGVKSTGDTYGPFFHTNLEPDSILKWVKIG